MRITLELAPEAEASLVAQAKARGLSLEAFLQTIITTRAAAIESVKSVQALPPGGKERDWEIDELFAVVKTIPYGIDEGAKRRHHFIVHGVLFHLGEPRG